MIFFEVSPTDILNTDLSVLQPDKTFKINIHRKKKVRLTLTVKKKTVSYRN